jgi:hypothetical protein
MKIQKSAGEDSIFFLLSVHQPVHLIFGRKCSFIWVTLKSFENFTWTETVFLFHLSVNKRSIQVSLLGSQTVTFLSDFSISAATRYSPA